MIFDNSIRQGELLSESNLAEMLNMSRTPIREAVRMLASENLVDVRNGVGIYVIPMTLQDIRDLYEVRGVLETLAATTSIYNITPEEADGLQQRFRRLRDDKESGKPLVRDAYFELDWELHEMIVNRCNNRYAISLMKTIHPNVRRCQEMSFQANEDTAYTTKEHLEILECIKKRDVDGLVETLKKHLKWSSEILIKKL